MASRNSRELHGAVQVGERSPRSFLEQFTAGVFAELSAFAVLCEAWQRTDQLSLVRFSPGFSYGDSTLCFVHCVEEHGANGNKYIVSIQHKPRSMSIQVDFFDSATKKSYRRAFRGSPSPWQVVECPELSSETMRQIPQLDLQHVFEVVLKQLQKTPNKAVLTR